MFKRGGYDLGRKAIYYILVIFILAFIFLYMRHAIVSFNDVVVKDSSRIEGAIITAEALMSPKCFAYHDEEIDRTYPGIIDLTKFNEANLNKKTCMAYIDSPYKIKLMDKILGNQEDILEIIRAPALVFDNGKLTPSIIEIGVEDYYARDSRKGPKGEADYP